jgi:SAM-dependent methyltransferase
MNSSSLNDNAIPQDFEFSALEQAHYYPEAIINEFKPYLGKHVLEVGAGVGQMSRHLISVVGFQSYTGIELDHKFCKLIKGKIPEAKIIEGTIDAYNGSVCDSIVSINVVEHIQDDARELRKYRDILAPTKGHVCILTPARPEIYSPIDLQFGHYRRYTRASMNNLLRGAGFIPVKTEYFNFIGYFAWLLNFKILQKSTFDPGMVKIFDRYLFRCSYLLEKSFIRPPIGQSILAIGKASE